MLVVAITRQPVRAAPCRSLRRSLCGFVFGAGLIISGMNDTGKSARLPRRARAPQGWLGPDARDRDDGGARRVDPGLLARPADASAARRGHRVAEQDPDRSPAARRRRAVRRAVGAWSASAPALRSSIWRRFRRRCCCSSPRCSSGWSRTTSGAAGRPLRRPARRSPQTAEASGAPLVQPRDTIYRLVLNDLTMLS